MNTQDALRQEVQASEHRGSGIVEFVRQHSTLPLQPDAGHLMGSAQGILDSLIANICVVDRDGTILAVNRAWNRFARENHYEPERSALSEPLYGIGRSYFDVCTDTTGEDASHAAIVAQNLKEILNGERDRFSIEYPCHSSGQQRWFLLTISPIVSEYGGGAIISHFNITEQTELRQANETLEAFAQSLALAFRSPLGKMRSTLTTLGKEADLLPSGMQSDLHNLDESIDLLDSMVRDLLAYARVGGAGTLLRPTDLHQSVNEAIYHYTAEIKRKNARISIAESFPYVMADQRILTEALECIISNALKFVPPGEAPELAIYAENKPEAVWLWIEDGGIGIDPKDHAPIFMIFRRAEGAARYPGNGIGLAIVERSMRQMKGFVEVFPREGGGSRFKLVFPKRTR